MSQGVYRGLAWEETRPRRRDAGMLLFEYAVWRSEASRLAGDEPYLLNNHRAMVRITHQRIRRAPGGEMRHVSGALVAVEDELEFMDTDPRAIQWQERAVDLEVWRDTDGQTMPAFRFPSYWGEMESLDPQWERELHIIPEEEQVVALIEAYLRRAVAQAREGDQRGTTLNLQVGASLDDGYWSDAGGTGSDFGDTAARLFCGHNNAAGTDVVHNWHRFLGVSGLAGATVNTADYQIWGDAADQGAPLTKIFANDVEVPVAPVDIASADAKVLTAAAVDWDSPGLSTVAFNSAPSIVAVIQELGDSFDPGAIMLLHRDDGSSTAAANQIRPSSYNRATAEAAKLDLDITEASAGILLPMMQHAS